MRNSPSARGRHGLAMGALRTIRAMGDPVPRGTLNRLLELEPENGFTRDVPARVLIEPIEAITNELAKVTSRGPASFDAPRPYLELPNSFENLVYIGGNEHRQLWRARAEGRVVALRLLRFPSNERLLFDPTPSFSRMGRIVGELAFEHLAEPLWCGGDGRGSFVSEAWVSHINLESSRPRSWSILAERLRTMVEDLVLLHQHGKIHGGIRPTRILWRRGRAVLTAMPWANVVAGFTKSLRHKIENPEEPGADFVAPELDAIGPSAAVWSLDSYALAKTLLTVTPEQPPAMARAVLEAALSPVASERPAVRDILDILV